MTRMAPAFAFDATLTSCACAFGDPRSMPAGGTRPPAVVWQFVHAARPVESVDVKMVLWMLLKVGARLGVGPVRLLSFSSHAMSPRSAHPYARLKNARLIDLLLALPAPRVCRSYHRGRFRNIPSTECETTPVSTRRTRS